MSDLSSPSDILLFSSLLFNQEKFSDFQEISYFKEQFLEIKDVFFPEFNPLIKYYSKEMGETLSRVILVFKQTYKRDDLIKFKKSATLFEKKHSFEQKRTVNIDIGFIALEQVVLATGKPYGHRLYLRDGVYAELTYIYTQGDYQTLPWTYPDYAYQRKRDFFSKIRSRLLVK